MTDFSRFEEIASNDRSLKKLVRSITNSQGNFALILVRCNYRSLREEIVNQLKKSFDNEIHELYLPSSIKTLYTTIKEDLGEQQPQVLMVFGLESVATIDQVLASTNQVREEFRKHFKFPIVLWIDEKTLRKMIRLSPDFKSWAAISIKFEVNKASLIKKLEETIETTTSTILDAGSGRFFNDVFFNVKGFCTISELEAALQDLQHSNQKNSFKSEANLHFLLGLAADHRGAKPKAREFYEESLELWEKEFKENNNSIDCSLYHACLLFYLGVWWRQYATKNRGEYTSACIQAKKYYQQCLNSFQQINRPDLVAKFINALGEVLIRLEHWDELEPVAQLAVNLHQNYSEPIRLAFGYALFAELALRKSNWKSASQYAALALQTNSTPSQPEFAADWNRQHYQSLYLLLLSEAQKNLGQNSEAVNNLEVARADLDPQYDPLLYVRILEALQAYYYKQCQYLKAFEIKQEQKSIEQQYGLRAFAGAGRLQARRQVNNPGLSSPSQHTTVTEEIAASGRMEDIHHLLERISRTDCKLIIIYGQSGVGKSSILQAGLIPTLEQVTFEAREVLPILLQVYTDWDKSFRSCLENNLRAIRACTSSTSLNRIADTLRQLKQNAELNLLTVLIFDQFEEFFFTYQSKTERNIFYNFLYQCLNTPFVKVILSLREDYLHYLLEFNRFYRPDIINNNILDKEILYYIGNFSRDDTKSVIQSITQHSQFHLEQELINELVQDLADNNGEIRPIELQVVGAQLQAENIVTLAQYKKYGPKRKLVEHFLEEVVKDCGDENSDIARLVLYLLTDENGTRPLKTKAELILSLSSAQEFKKLDEVLEIFVKSGLVFFLPEVSIERYQLVHDYLVEFIRQEQGTELTKKLKESEERRKLSEAQLIQARRGKIQLTFLTGLFIFLTVLSGWLTILASQERSRAQLNGLRALISSSENLFSSNRDFDALSTSLKAAKLLKKETVMDPDSRQKVSAVLEKSIYRVKEYIRLENHTDWINDLSFSIDGQIVASASSDEKVNLWNLNGQLLHQLSSENKGHSDRVNKVVFSHNRRFFATSSNDNTIKLWTITGVLYHTFKGHTQWVGDIAFSPDDKTIASVSSDGTLRLWSLSDFSSKKILMNDEGLDWLGVVRFSPSGKTIIAGGNDGKLKFYNTLTEKVSESSEEHGDSITDIEVSLDGDVIASASSDQTIKLWNPKGQLIHTLEGHRDQVNRIKFNSDGTLLISGSRDKTVKLWSREGKLLKTLGEHSGAVNDVAFSLDGKTIISASDDKTIKFWSLGGKLLRSLEGHTDGVNLIRLSPNGKILASASNDKTVRLWKLDTSNDIQLLPKLSGSVSKVAFKKNGEVAVLVNDDPKVWFYSSNGRWLRTLTGHYDSVLSLDFSSDEKQMVTASADGNLRVFNTSEQQNPVLWLKRGTKQTLGSYTTSGIYVDTTEDLANLTVTGLDEDSPAAKSGVQKGSNILEIDGESTKGLSRTDAYRLLDYKPGKNVTLKLEHQGVSKLLSVVQGQVKWYASMTAATFSPSQNLIAAGSEDGFVTLWDHSGKLHKELKGDGTVTSLSFSPNGKALASASTDETVKLWRINEKSPEQSRMYWEKRHRKPVFAVNFSPDGHTIASAGEDRLVHLWNFDGSLRMTLPKDNHQDMHDGRINSIAFSPNGQKIVSASEDKTVKVWDLSGKLRATFYGHNAPVIAVHVEKDNQTITSVSSDGVMIRWREADLELNTLFDRGCKWLRNYLSSSSVEDRHLCETTGSQNW